MTFRLPELSYSYDALEPYIDAKTMEIHYTKHHQGYLTKLNAALDKEGLTPSSAEGLIYELEGVPLTIRDTVRNNGGGYVNHKLFWEILGPGKGGAPVGSLHAALAGKYGSFEAFKELFTTTAATRFGSGWAWLSVDKGELVVSSTANQDSPLLSGATPILGLDVWEHAYYLKYQNRRPDYIAAWWNVIDWEAVEEKYRSALG